MKTLKKGGVFYTDPSNGFSYPLPGDACGYLTMPGIDIETEGSWDEAIINDHGVCISATESIYTNDKAKAADPFVDDGIGEQSEFRTIVTLSHQMMVGSVRSMFRTRKT